MNRSGVKEMKHKWACYVKIVDDDVAVRQHKIIEKVKMELHPTFANPTRWIEVKQNEPMEIETVAWGSFDINITIYWHSDTGKEDPFTLNHSLLFREGGKSRRVKFQFDKNKI